MTSDFLHIQIDDKRYSTNEGNENIVIKDLEIEVGANEFLCLYGPSGCGKSTLLNMISGLDSNFTGTISMADQSTPFTSYIFQTPRLLPWRTVIDNIKLAVGEEHFNEQASIDLLTKLGLATHIDSFPNHISLGMQRRVAIARAFLTPSNVLLMDEPFVSLDQPTARKARAALIELWTEKPQRVIFVTHDLNEAIELADRILFLSKNPCQIKESVLIDIPRDARNETNIDAFKQGLIEQHPSLKQLI